MKIIFFSLFRFSLAGVLLSGGLALAAAKRSLAGSMPSGAVVYIEMDGLGGKVRQFRKSGLYADILKSPQYKEFESSSEYTKMWAGRTMAETLIGMDFWMAAERLLGGQLALGFYPRKGQAEPEALAILRVKGTEALKKIHGRLKPFIWLADDIDRSVLPGGAELFKLENNFFVATKGDWIVGSENRGLLLRSVKMLGGQASKSVAQNPSYQKMLKKMGDRHLAKVYVNIPEFARQYNQPLQMPGKLDNGGASFFFHGIMELFAGSLYLGLTVDSGEKGFSVVSAIEGDMEAARKKYGWFFSEPGTPGTRDIPQVAGLMGGITIHRNIGDWYRNREKLLEERLMAGFDEFESGLGSLFPGQDVGEDIMPALGSTTTFLAAKQTFEHFEGEPGVKLPGFALIFDLAKPENGALFQLVFQTIVTITNIASAEEGLNREPSVMTAVAHKGVPINTIQYLRPPKGKRLNMSYNFQPCAATVNGRFVFCTSLQLCKALVEEMAKPQDKARVNRNFNFEMYPGALASLAKTNRNTLVAQSIQTGKTAKQANWEFDTLLRLVEGIDIARFSTSVLRDGFQIKFEGKWK
jgi:hypothetical protein